MVAGVLSISLVWWIGTHKTLEDAHDRTTDSELVHGNDDRSTRAHIVYEIYAIGKMGIKYTLKYGISGQRGFLTKWGYPRPQYQAIKFQAYPEYHSFFINYTVIYSKVPGRRKAKQLEQMLVNKYFALNATMPPEQKRPIPKNF